MIQLEELRTNLTNIKPELMELRGALDLENGAKEAAELEQKTSAPGFWDEPEQSQKVLQRIKQLKDKAARYEKLEGLYNDTLELIDMALEEGEESLYQEVQQDYDKFQAMLESFFNSAEMFDYMIRNENAYEDMKREEDRKKELRAEGMRRQQEEKLAREQKEEQERIQEQEQEQTEEEQQILEF